MSNNTRHFNANVKINDLETLRAAVVRATGGLMRFDETQKTNIIHAFGPDGGHTHQEAPADGGAIVWANPQNPDTHYTVGVRREQDGYALWADFWAPGETINPLIGVIGENCSKIFQAYQIEKACRIAINKGDTVEQIIDLPGGGKRIRVRVLAGA